MTRVLPLCFALACISFLAATPTASAALVLSNGDFEAGLADWSMPGGGWGTYVPGAGQYPSGYAPGSGNVAYGNANYIYQNLGTLEDNTLYTFTLDYGNRADEPVAPWEVLIRYGFDPTANPNTIVDVDYGTGALPTLADGTFATSGDFIVSTGAGGNADGLEGQNLLFIVNGTNLQVNIDNVTLTSQAVPEPATSVLLVSGVLMGGLLLWRKRRG